MKLDRRFWRRKGIEGPVSGPVGPSPLEPPRAPSRVSLPVSTPAQAPAGRIAADDDATLLRKTRLRLMTVSGLVTLAILVVLGTSIYLTSRTSWLGPI